MTAAPIFILSTSASTEYAPRALVESCDARSRSASVLLAPEATPAALVREAIRYVRRMAVLPVDAEADADFAEFKNSLARTIPRRVIKRT